MNKKEALFWYILSIIILVIFGIYSISQSSQWIIDNVTGIVCISIGFFLIKWLHMRRTEFLLYIIGFMIHNMGTFGWYEYTRGWFSYDMIVHFVSAFACAWISYNFLVHRLKIPKSSPFEYHFIMIFLAISITALLGTFVELIEFYGFTFFGPGEGLFFAGPGDTKFVDDIIGNYIDTMIDIIVNVIGSIVGSFAYYFRAKNLKRA